MVIELIESFNNIGISDYLGKNVKVVDYTDNTNNLSLVELDLKSNSNAKMLFSLSTAKKNEIPVDYIPLYETPFKIFTMDNIDKSDEFENDMAIDDIKDYLNIIEKIEFQKTNTIKMTFLFFYHLEAFRNWYNYQSEKYGNITTSCDQLISIYKKYYVNTIKLMNHLFENEYDNISYNLIAMITNDKGSRFFFSRPVSINTNSKEFNINYYL